MILNELIEQDPDATPRERETRYSNDTKNKQSFGNG